MPSRQPFNIVLFFYTFFLVQTPPALARTTTTHLMQTDPDSTSIYFFLALCGIVLLAGGILGFVIFRRPYTVLHQGSSSRPKKQELSGQARPRGQVSLFRQIEQTEPIPIQRSSPVWSKEDDQQQPHQTLEPRSRPRPAFQSQTEPIKVASPESDWPDLIDNPPTEQFDPYGYLGFQDKLLLKVLSGDQQGATFTLHGLQGIISRGKAGQITLADNKVSAPHATLALYQMQLGHKDQIRDLGSKNGTFKNGVQLNNQWADLNDGDILQFGLTKLRYDQPGRRLIDEAQHQPPLQLSGNNRWLITRRELPFIDFESDDPSISVPHLYIKADDHLEVRDLSSGNGIYVQGHKIEGRELIFDEDIIQFGRETELQVSTDIDNVPQEIGGWHKEGWIGGGGMADIYRIRQRGTNHLRALKIPRPSKYRRQDQAGILYRQLFKREAELARQIEHPNFVEIYQFDELPTSRLPYLMMKYIDGPSVETILEKLKDLSLPDVVEIARHVGQALHCLHTQYGYVHCDVKPNNIVIDTHGQVYLTDLGVAIPIAQQFSGLGVPKYLPREVLKGEGVGPDTDIYSLGQTMFEMLTHQSLTTPQTTTHSAAKQSKVNDVSALSPTEQITTAAHELPATALMRLTQTAETRDLALIIKICTDSQRKNRYQTMAELLPSLEPLCTGADLKQLVARTGWKPTSPIYQ